MLIRDGFWQMWHEEVSAYERGYVPELPLQEQMPGAEQDVPVPVIQKKDPGRVEPSEVQVTKNTNYLYCKGWPIKNQGGFKQ